LSGVRSLFPSTTALSLLLVGMFAAGSFRFDSVVLVIGAFIAYLLQQAPSNGNNS
jgi:hypothetical protein